MDIINKITDYITSLVAESPIFLIEVTINPVNNFKIFLDSDEGLKIEECRRINRSLYKFMEEAAFYPDGDFSLEVSSPGIDVPLKLLRQYKKNISRTLEVKTIDDVVVTGVMTVVTDDFIVLETVVPKQKEKKVTEIPFTQIKTAEVQVVF